VSPHNTMRSGPRPTFVPSGILIHPAVWPQQMWAKNLGFRPFFLGGGEAESPSNTMSLGPRPTSLPSGILNILGHNRYRPKCRGAPPAVGGGGAGSSCHTMWAEPRPTCMPSFILIHPAIWSQQIWAENWGLRTLLGDGELGSHITQCGQGRGLRACQVSS